jgi:hypothetical protein
MRHSTKSRHLSPSHHCGSIMSSKEDERPVELIYMSEQLTFSKIASPRGRQRQPEDFPRQHHYGTTIDCKIFCCK